MKKWILIIGLFILSCFFGISQVGADTIDFDDLSTKWHGVGDGPDDYAGFEWYGSWGVVNPAEYWFNENAFDSNLVSGKNVGYMGQYKGDKAGFKSESTFDLYSINLAAGWNNNLEVRLEGKADGVTLGSMELVLSAELGKASLIEFDDSYKNINELSFEILDVGDPYWGDSYGYVSMENITYDMPAPVPTPEPSTILLMGVSLICLLGVRKKVGKR